MAIVRSVPSEKTEDPLFRNLVNPLSASPTKWSNTLKQFADSDYK